MDVAYFQFENRSRTTRCRVLHVFASLEHTVQLQTHDTTTHTDTHTPNNTTHTPNNTTHTQQHNTHTQQHTHQHTHQHPHTNTHTTQHTQLPTHTKHTTTCTFHDVYCSKPLTFHKIFMFFASRSCFKHFLQISSSHSSDLQRGTYQ